MNPIVRILVQVAVQSVGVIARAFVQAVQQAQAGGGGAARAAAATTAKRRGMALDEAREILNLKPADVTRPKVLAQCERYFAMNDPAKGGSIYLQSKITNAKEALLEEMEKEGDASDDEAHNGRHDAR